MFATGKTHPPPWLIFPVEALLHLRCMQPRHLARDIKAPEATLHSCLTDSVAFATVQQALPALLLREVVHVRKAASAFSRAKGQPQAVFHSLIGTSQPATATRCLDEFTPVVTFGVYPQIFWLAEGEVKDLVIGHHRPLVVGISGWCAGDALSKPGVIGTRMSSPPILSALGVFGAFQHGALPASREAP